MCWRGHELEHHYPRLNGNGLECRCCHKLRMRAYRAGYPVRHRPLFSLNKVEYDRVKASHGWRNYRIVAFSGVSLDHLTDFGRRKKTYRATRETAVRIAQVMGCTFSQLWSEA